MKFLKVITALVLAIPVLSGCANQGSTSALPSEATKASPTPSLSLVSDQWAEDKNLKASTVSDALVKAGICAIPDGSFKEPFSDTKEWNNDTIRVCRNYKNYDKEASAMECPISYYVTVGKDLGTSTGHMLNYEDGYDLAVLFAPGWEIYVTPDGDMIMNKEPSAAIKMCASTIENLRASVGGTIEFNE